jgi:1D-myo-inositol 3-kinase
MRVVTVGHVTNDSLAGGIYPGGAALYAGLAAHALGAEVTLVTRAGPDFVGGELLAQLHRVLALKAPFTTTFDERYLDRRRAVRLLGKAGPVDAPLPAADVLLLCPVADEVSLESLRARPGRLLAAGLQGWLRRFAPDGTVVPSPLLDGRPFSGCGLVSCSAEDLEGLGPETLEALRATVPRVAVTEGVLGARLYAGNEAFHLAAWPVEAVDPTGAGDVFLATLALQLAQGASLLEAGVWAVCAGALAVKSAGPTGLGALRGLVRAVEAYRRDAPSPRRLSAGE